MISMGESEKCILKLEPGDARSPSKDCVQEAAARARSSIDFDMTIYMYIYKYIVYKKYSTSGTCALLSSKETASARTHACTARRRTRRTRVIDAWVELGGRRSGGKPAARAGRRAR
jgi:hypothetical protein